MKIALAQLNYHIGNFEANTKKIIETIKSAKSKKADLIVFAELAIGGYPAKDLLRNQSFLTECRDSLRTIANECFGITCVIGSPIKNIDPEGKALHNAVVIIENGEIKGNIKKRFLPDYDVFDEYRYFEPNHESHCVKIADTKIALTICEDLWDNDTDNSYVGDILEDLLIEQPDVIINIAASPFSYIQFEKRIDILRSNVKNANIPLIYVNQVGAHADLIFDGRSLVLDKNGAIISELKAFEEDLKIVELINGIISADRTEHPNKTEIAWIHDALIFGIKEYFSKSGFSKAVLGLSGGLDSAIVAALACEALGAENVLAILLPSKYSSDHSIKDALDLIHNTGCNHQVIPIQPMVDSFEKSLSDLFKGYHPNITEENIQARVRATILMAASNKLGNILLNTSNKSEAAVGYGTLYGDMAGAISVIGDVYKTQAYELAKYINRDREIIPVNTIVKPPSAELRPDQKDSDSLPAYDILDGILFHFIENEKSTGEIIQLGFDEDLVMRISKLLTNAEFKRYQAPPILRVSSKSFGVGRSMPLVTKFRI